MFREDWIRNEYKRSSDTWSVGVIFNNWKNENRLKLLLRYVLKSEETEALRIIKEMYAGGKKGKERPKRR